MKNLTLRADEDLIEKARAIARAQRRTLNAAFREWLTHFTARWAIHRRPWSLWLSLWLFLVAVAVPRSSRLLR